MKYSFSTLQKILRVLADGERYKPSIIAKSADISRPTANKYLKKLLEEDKILKQGKGSHVTYAIADSSFIPENSLPSAQEVHDFDYEQSVLLDQYFLKYTADGGIQRGVSGFLARCEQRNFNPYDQYARYAKIVDTLESLRTPCGMLDATDEFIKHVDIPAMGKIYYADQYKLNEFGRSKLAEMAFFGKQTQHVILMQDVMEQIYRKIECLIKTLDIDALAFTPPSISRKHQILDFLDIKMEHISLPRINLVKDYPGDIVTPQKALKKREQRKMNARKSIYVYDDTTKNYNTVLLIDDFVGSGSTLNETAKKLKKEGVKTVIGFAIVGNLDLSYDVINEV